MIDFARIQFIRSRTKRALEAAAEAGELKQVLSSTQATVVQPDIRRTLSQEELAEVQNEAARKIQRLFLRGTARQRRLINHLQLAVRLSRKKTGVNTAKMGKQKLMCVKYWIEAADPKHRYGSLMYPYYKEWMQAGTSQSFFTWLDTGEGSKIDLQESPRVKLMGSKVDYMDKAARMEWEVCFENKDGDCRMCWMNGDRAGERVSTPKRCCFSLYRFGCSTAYIFVVDYKHRMYIHPKKKGHFHHSSFLGGKAAIAAGGVVVKDGKLLVVNGNSGHYKPSAVMLEKTFKHFEKESGLDRNSYLMVYPALNKLCGCQCCPPMVESAPFFGTRRAREMQRHYKSGLGGAYSFREGSDSVQTFAQPAA